MSENTRILDGKGADGWNLGALPSWVLGFLAPLNAQARGRYLAELQSALLASAPPMTVEACPDIEAAVERDRDHGNCPACGADLNGDLIWQTLVDQGKPEAKADEIAANFYGATRTTGRWGRQIAIYSRERDRTVAHRCPDCEHEWEV